MAEETDGKRDRSGEKNNTELRDGRNHRKSVTLAGQYCSSAMCSEQEPEVAKEVGWLEGSSN